MKITSPLYVELGANKKKKYYLNLNNYRNWHYQVSNNIKKKYGEIMKEQIQGLQINTPIMIEYTLFLPDKRKRDISNILCIVDKFFCDTLVENGVIEDDSMDHIEKVVYNYGCVDHGKGRVNIVITEIQ